MRFFDEIFLLTEIAEIAEAAEKEKFYNSWRPLYEQE